MSSAERKLIWVLLMVLAIGLLGEGYIMGRRFEALKSSPVSAVPDTRAAVAIGMVREYLRARPWGTIDCLQQHTKYSAGAFEATVASDGSVQVRHPTTVGVSIWRVFVAEKVIDPVQRPSESFC